MSHSPESAEPEPLTESDADGGRPLRPRGFIPAAAIAGAIAAVSFFGAALFPAYAPHVAAISVFIGVGAGALLMRRARDRSMLAAIARGDEFSADRDWELSDIAEHYRVNAKGRRQRARRKSRFLTHASHELRTPLSGIVGLTEVLLETPLTAEQETFARAVRISGELMQGLVDDILDFAKIEAERFELRPADVDLEQIVEEVAELFFRAEAKGLELATYVDPTLPTRMSVDPARLRQVLINLIGNGLKFTATGSVAIIVEADEADGERIKVAVVDTGPGIPAEHAARIFGEFERLDIDQRFDGSGLGLAIAQQIVRRMGAEIKVGERPGGGSVFSFSLPRPTAGSMSRRPDVDLAGKRTLLVAPGDCRRKSLQDISPTGAEPRGSAAVSARARR